MTGDFTKATEKGRDAVRIDPNSASGWFNLAYSYMGAKRFDEAQQTMRQAMAKFPESELGHWFTYVMDLAVGKTADADRELAWSKGKQYEFRFLSTQARSFLDQGKLRLAEENTKRMLDMENNQGLGETADGDLGFLAMTQADLGVCDRALKNATALAASSTRAALTQSAYVFATCGQAQKAEANAARLNKEYPLDSFLQKSELPQIRARLDLQRGNAAKALDDLHSEAFQLGFVEAGLPVYLRASAYLQTKQGADAAAEFQKILDDRGALAPLPYMSLAKLGQARAYALTGDASKSRTAYQDFFTIWKDADPDIPILKQAKAEYTKLQ